MSFAFPVDPSRISGGLAARQWQARPALPKAASGLSVVKHLRYQAYGKDEPRADQRSRHKRALRRF